MRKKAKTIIGIFEKDTRSNPSHDLNFEKVENGYWREAFGDQKTHPYLVRLLLKSVGYNLYRGRFSNTKSQI